MELDNWRTYKPFHLFKKIDDELMARLRSWHSVNIELIDPGIQSITYLSINFDFQIVFCRNLMLSSLITHYYEMV